MSKSAPDPTHAALWPLGHEEAMMEGLQSFVSFELPCRRGSGYNREGSAISKERKGERGDKATQRQRWEHKANRMSTPRSLGREGGLGIGRAMGILSV